VGHTAWGVITMLVYGEEPVGHTALGAITWALLQGIGHTASLVIARPSHRDKGFARGVCLHVLRQSQNLSKSRRDPLTPPPSPSFLAALLGAVNLGGALYLGNILSTLAAQTGGPLPGILGLAQVRGRWFVGLCEITVILCGKGDLRVLVRRE
jgi:hypothetical protein